MSFVKKWKGKYVKIDVNNPDALGVCDESGLDFNHKDLVKQMEWRGNNLVWNGLMVGKPYLDKPQPQNRPPFTKDDPRPVINARFPSEYNNPDSNTVLSHTQLMDKLNNVKWNE